MFLASSQELQFSNEEPKTNTSYWEKFQTNIARDKKVQERLDKENWKFLIIWECEIKDIPELEKKN